MTGCAPAEAWLATAKITAWIRLCTVWCGNCLYLIDNLRALVFNEYI